MLSGRQHEGSLKGYLILILNQSCGTKWERNFFLKNPQICKIRSSLAIFNGKFENSKGYCCSSFSLWEKSPKDTKTFGCGFEYNRWYCPFIRQTGEENTSVSV